MLYKVLYADHYDCFGFSSVNLIYIKPFHFRYQGGISLHFISFLPFSAAHKVFKKYKVEENCSFCQFLTIHKNIKVKSQIFYIII